MTHSLPGNPSAHPAPPEFVSFASVVMRFVDASESLLKGELSHPFNIGSEALRDCAASPQHLGTQSKQMLVTLATQQVAAGLEQCDLLRGIAAVVQADQVVFAPFPLARTCGVIAAKAWYVLTAESRQERLRRFLNEELAALSGIPVSTSDDEAASFVAEKTEDYLTVGATTGLSEGRRRNPKRWDAPFLVRPDQAESEAPPSETQLMKNFFRVAGMEDELAPLPYSLLSAATHGRFRQAGYTGYSPVGPSEGGVSTSAIQVTLEVTAQTTIYAAFATRVYLCALADYTCVSQAVVIERLRQPLSEWMSVAIV